MRRLLSLLQILTWGYGINGTRQILEHQLGEGLRPRAGSVSVVNLDEDNF